MKKYISVILFPYFILINLFFFTGAGNFSDYPQPVKILLYSAFFLVNGAEIFFVIACIIRAFKAAFSEEPDASFMKQVIISKLLQIPAYILIFMIGFICFPIRLGFLITLFCFAGDLLSIAITGLLMTSVMIAGLRGKIVSKSSAIVHGILSFIFCIDVADAIYLLIKKRRGSSDAA